MPHTEIPIKVTAWVDEGIAPLVSAINQFPDIVTVDSCEGKRGASGHVFFVHRGGAMALAGFVHSLSAAIGERLDLNNEFSIQIEWTGGAVEPLAALYVQRDFLKPLAQTVEAVAAAGISAYHRSACCGGS